MQLTNCAYKCIIIQCKSDYAIFGYLLSYKVDLLFSCVKNTLKSYKCIFTKPIV